MIDLNRTRTYQKVLLHRETCSTWNNNFVQSKLEICMDCFGGGLNQFLKDLEKENEIRLRTMMITETERTTILKAHQILKRENIILL